MTTEAAEPLFGLDSKPGANLYLVDPDSFPWALDARTVRVAREGLAAARAALAAAARDDDDQSREAEGGEALIGELVVDGAALRRLAEAGLLPAAAAPSPQMARLTDRSEMSDEMRAAYDRAKATVSPVE